MAPKCCNAATALGVLVTSKNYGSIGLKIFQNLKQKKQREEMIETGEEEKALYSPGLGLGKTTQIYAIFFCVPLHMPFHYLCKLIFMILSNNYVKVFLRCF